MYEHAGRVTNIISLHMLQGVGNHSMYCNIVAVRSIVVETRLAGRHQHRFGAFVVAKVSWNRCSLAVEL